ncbi:hypothetical protein CT113_03795 [Levilactobacillus brevis]|uniref:hypothetical protein n=1 Tax=Levilactobacillus brevis TaxID=1580 RepID=UPI0004209C0C|nr:hypothetical protein [Levilactobacillus brevis]ATU69508.1 hypothetical protein CT113_03795 [Levilactobacillus brevis]KID42955.1 hypothetical protein LbDm2_2187 [Levilactobacillus brevis]
MASKSDFEKVTAYLFVLSVGVGLYPIQIIGEFMRDVNSRVEVDPSLDIGVPGDIKKIYEGWTDKEEAAFLIFFGRACMDELEDN